MIKTRLLTAVAFGLGLMALPTIGDAQSFQGNQPIMWGADNVSRTPTALSMRGRAEPSSSRPIVAASRRAS